MTTRSNLARGHPQQQAARTAVTDAMALGISQRRAAALAGVDESTVLRWKRADPEFALAVEAARSRWQQYLLTHLRTAIEAAARLPGNVKAVMFALERGFPDDFGAPMHGVTNTSPEQAASDLDAYWSHITGVSPTPGNQQKEH